MAHFAQIDKDNKVIQVIVAEQNIIDSGLFGEPSSWIQTSYNTNRGVNPNGKALRKNFAGVGYTYDEDRDAFIAPKVFESWILNEETCCWEPPSDFPLDGKMYTWNEEQRKWLGAE